MNKKTFEKNAKSAIVEYVENGSIVFWRVSHCYLTVGGWREVRREKVYLKETSAIKSAEKYIAA